MCTGDKSYKFMVDQHIPMCVCMSIYIHTIYSILCSVTVKI